MVNTDAIDGLIDLLVGESVIDACKPLSKTAGSRRNTKCSVQHSSEFYAGPTMYVVCSIGEGNDNYFVGCTGLDVKAN